MSTEYGKGSIFSVPDLRDYRGVTSQAEFPKEFSLLMPAVKNQGSVSSCVAHSLATVCEYYNTKQNSPLEMSTGYIYGNRLLSTHKGSGMYTRDAIKTLAKFGDVPYDCFMPNVEVPDAIRLFEKYADDELMELGTIYRIDSYFKLKDDAAMKSHLLSGNPIIFAMKWFDDIKLEDGVMITQQVVTKKTGGHCMVIYGWNEQGWLVQNSWGKHWGADGRFTLPYNIPRKETWGVIDAKSTTLVEIKKPFNSKFGEWCAKIIHKIITCAYNIYYKIKERK